MWVESFLGFRGFSGVEVEWIYSEEISRISPESGKLGSGILLEDGRELPDL